MSFKHIHFCLNQPWYEYVKNGDKIWEGRSLCNPKVLTLSVGDTITFHHPLSDGKTMDMKSETFSRKVVEIRKYNNFKEGLVDLGLSSTLPGVSTIEEGCEIYKKFVSENTQAQYGIAMIRLN